MSLTKTIYSKEEGTAVNPQTGMPKPSNDADQILHLKRLLVTLKQQYETGLHQLNEQLHVEQKKVLELSKKNELSEKKQLSLLESHEEELVSLRKQILALREASKKASIIAPEIEEGRLRIEQLERVIPYLRERTNEANLETEQLREHLSEVQKKKHDLEKEWQQRNVEAQNEIQQLKDRLNRQIEKTEHITSTHVPTDHYQELADQKTASDNKVKQHAALVETLQYNLKEIEKQKDELDKKHKEKTLQYEQLSSEKSGLEFHEKQLVSQLETKIQDHRALEIQLVELEKEKIEYETMLSTKCRELKDEVNEKSKLQQRINDLKTEMDHRTTQLNEQLKNLENDKKSVEGWLQEKNHRYNDLLTEKENYKTQVYHLQNETEQKVKHIHSLQDQFRDLQLQKQSLDTLVNNKTHAYDELLNKKAALESQNHHLEVLLEENVSKINALQGQNQSLDSAINEKSRVCEELANEKSALDLQIHHLKRVLEDHVSQIHSLEERNQAIDVLFNEKGRVCDELTNEKLALESQIQHLLSAIDQHLSQIHSLQSQLDKVHSQNQSLEIQFNDKSRVCDELVNEKSILESQNHQLQTALEQHLDQIHSLQDQSVYLENQRQLLDLQLNEKNELYSASLNEKMNLESQIHDFEISLEQHIQHIQSLQGQLHHLDLQKQSLESLLVEKNGDFEKLLTVKHNLDSQVFDLSEINDHLTNDVKSLHNQLYHLGHEKQTIEIYLNEKARAYEELLNIKEGLDHQALSLQEALNGLNQEKIDLVAALSERNGQYGELLSEKVALDDHVGHLNGVIEQQTTQIDSLQERLHNIELQKQSLESLLDVKTRIHQELTKENENHEQQNAELIKNLDENKNQIHSLLGQLHGLEQDKLFLEKSLSESFSRYEDISIEKNQLLAHTAQLKHDVENQFHYIEELNAKVHEKDILLSDKQKINEEFRSRISILETIAQEKVALQDLYSRLEEDKKQLEVLYFEEKSIRIDGENKFKEQLALVHTKETQISQLHYEKETLEQNLATRKSQLEDSEQNFKTAQQHLAKKVKEVALLNEKAQHQQYSLNEYQRNIETYKGQVAQLHSTVEQYQSLENKLKLELHETQKNAESQITKWEEKYFSLYDKWQENELKVRELQKIEEKHNQVQGILANLGSFISTPTTSSLSSSAPLPASTPRQQLRETAETAPASFFEYHGGGAFFEDQVDYSNGQFDIFGMQVNKAPS